MSNEIDDFNENVADDDFDDDMGNRISGAYSRAAVEYIVRNIVRDPSAVSVDTQDTASGVKVSVHVGPDDKGMVIGRRGRTANSLRTVARAVGAREGVSTTVDIPDDE